MSKNRVYVSENLFFSAFRYNLGRMTMGTHDFIDEAILILPDLTERTLKDMIKEIEEAIQENRAGMQCDVDGWKHLLEQAKEAEKYTPA